MNLFGKKTENPVDDQFTRRHKAGIVTDARIRRHNLVSHLQEKANGYSKRKKIILLALLITVVSGYNIWLIYHCFFIPVGASKAIHQITVPLGVNPFEGKWFADGIDENKHRQIMAFQSYLDSLSQTEGGRAEYDRITTSRPGLMDSLLLFERIYGLQKAKPVPPQGYDTPPKN